MDGPRGKKKASTIDQYKDVCPPHRWDELKEVIKACNGNHDEIMNTVQQWWDEPPTTTTPTRSRPKILLLGDSLTQLAWDGWAARLAHVYQRRADVVNRGMAGYNTDWYLEYMTREATDVFVDNVCLVVIFFGANDASHPELNPRHHVSLEQYKENLVGMIETCQSHYGQKVPIVLMTPPPVQHEQRLKYQVERYGDKATGKLERSMEISEEYAQAAVEVANSHHVSCIHLWGTMQKDSDWSRFFYDGLHFTKEGNDFVAEQLLSTIATEHPDLAVQPCSITNQYGNSASSCPSLQQHGPFHDEIDHTDPSRAFEKAGTKN